MSEGNVAPPTCLERLEPRRLLSDVIAVGWEFQVNTFTTSGQRFPSIAADADGDFVVAWESIGKDGSGFSAHAQRYNNGGVPQESEFGVNTYTTGNQSAPSVAIDVDGDFVVAWGSDGQDGSISGIYAQRYNSAGVTQGAEFRVNNYTTGNQNSPQVAMDSAGDFVVAWTSSGQDGSVDGVYAQRYNATGVAQGAEFNVNTYTSGTQSFPTVAMDSAGDFVIGWMSNLEDGSGYGIYAQRYNAAGIPQGGEFRDNTYTTGNQGLGFSGGGPSVAMDSVGDFVVTWMSTGAQDGSGDGIYSQRYDAAGLPQGGEFRVNTFTTDNQRTTSVAMDAEGDFVVVWLSKLQDGSSYGVYSQRFNAAGVAQGSEFKVNTYTTDGQFDPTVAMDSAGDFVVAWYGSVGHDGSGYGVYAQRYAVVPEVTA